MDRRFLEYYERELQHLREMGAEFAKQYPKIAGRFGLEGFECADPYVERLLEGFGFLAARVQLKIDAEFPRFTQHLFESVYPGYLAPTPSMAIVQFQPDPAEGALAAGFTVPRDSALRSVLGRGEQTPCEYRTAHDVTLWPLEIAEAEYFRYSGSAAALGIPALPNVRAGIRLRLRTTGGLRVNQLALDRLCLHVRGSEELPTQIVEQLLANAVAVVARPARTPAPWYEVIDRAAIRSAGFADDEALLPGGTRSFSGYRLLQEYFALPARFMFVEIGGLQPAVRRCAETELDVLVLLDRSQPALEQGLGAAHFALYCTPAINLFPKRVDRVPVVERAHEHHVVPDKTRPIDYEVHSIVSVTGHSAGAEPDHEFLPFYTTKDAARQGGRRAYFATHRIARPPSERQKQTAPRTRYLGSEVFISLVDADEAPYPADLRELSIAALCTNRDLPLTMTLGAGRTDFTMASGAPVRAVRCLGTPTPPRPSWAEGETAWRLVSHLALNYVSLVDVDEKRGAAALRELLALYADPADQHLRSQVEGVRSVVSRPVVERVATEGTVSYGRGLELTLTLDDAAFRGTGAFMLGAVLEQFFARYVAINAFTQTVVRTVDRGEIVRWPARSGRRPIL